MSHNESDDVALANGGNGRKFKWVWAINSDRFGNGGDGTNEHPGRALRGTPLTSVAGCDDLILNSLALSQWPTNTFIEAATTAGCPGLSHSLGRAANFEIYKTWLASQ